MAAEGKPHAVCIPYPTQGHINPIFKLAKLLHHRGFYVTFVNTEYNHRRLLKSRGLNSLDGLPDFRFESIPDALPLPLAESDIDVTQDIPSLSDSTSKNSLAPFCSLISRLNNNNMPQPPQDFIPPVTCIVSDGAMSFTLKAAQQFGLPEVLFWTTSACGFLGYANCRQLIQRGYVPLKDMSYVNNGYLETTLDWVHGAKGIMRLRDFPSFIRTTDRNDIMLNLSMKEAETVHKASALILNTFDALEHDVLEALSEMFPRVYTIGSLQLMLNQMDDEITKFKSILGNSNLHLWKEEPGCIDWLNTKEPNSVVYVNFGSITVMSRQQLTEFAWGLANSKKSFLWIIRPDALGQSEGRGTGTGTGVITLPPEFVNETKDRGMMASWCPQEQVLKHPAIGSFLTHSGWNSTLESICSGVPVICWPFFAEQPTNCRYCCVEWGVGMEIDTDVKRDEVEKLVRALMEGEKGKELKKNAMNWKKKAEEAAAPGGSSSLNFDRLLKLLLLPD